MLDFATLETISADEKMRELVNAREKSRLDQISKLKYAERQGIEKGKKEEKINSIVKLLTRKIGIMPSEIVEKFNKLDIESLDDIFDKVLDAKDLTEVKELIK